MKKNSNQESLTVRMSDAVLSGFGEYRNQNSLTVGDNAALQRSSVSQMNQESVMKQVSMFTALL